jgi:hypothetical protein
VLERPVAQLTCDSVTRDISNKRVCSPVLRATNVVYARIPGDQWAVTWTAYNRWVPELLIGKGETEVAPFAMAAELKAAVRLMCTELFSCETATADIAVPRAGRLERVPRYRCQAPETRCSRRRPSRVRCLLSRRRVWLICRVPARRPDLCVPDYRHVGEACRPPLWPDRQRGSASVGASGRADGHGHSRLQSAGAESCGRG